MCTHLHDDVYFFFFKQNTAYDMRISDWSSDVCSSDLVFFTGHAGFQRAQATQFAFHRDAAGMGHGDGLLGDAHVVFVVGRGLAVFAGGRSEERRVGKESVSTCGSLWSL